MNGPTRSKAFERQNPVGRGRGASAADAWPDEMDQFVDSEPLAWTGKPRRTPTAPPPRRTAPSARRPT